MSFRRKAADGSTIIDGSPKQSWPLGAIFLSVINTNPAWFFGGTWVEFGKGRVLVGVDPAQAEFDTVEETGGAKTHTLTTAEIPSHVHQEAAAMRYVSPAGNAGYTTGTQMIGNQVVNTGPAGGGGAHNNLQPYITVYMWKRTA